METGYTWKIMERDNFLRGQDCDSQICQSSCYLLGDVKHIFCYILPPAGYLPQGRERRDKSNVFLRRIYKERQHWRLSRVRKEGSISVRFHYSPHLQISNKTLLNLSERCKSSGLHKVSRQGMCWYRRGASSLLL